jgi:hypothetical protein
MDFVHAFARLSDNRQSLSRGSACSFSLGRGRFRNGVDRQYDYSYRNCDSHSAVPPPPNGRPVDARLLDEIHRARGYGAFYWGRFYHIGYHYVILPDGTIEHGRPERCLGSHARGYNSYIGVCLVGDFSSRSNPK